MELTAYDKKGKYVRHITSSNIDVIKKFKIDYKDFKIEMIRGW